MRPLVLNGIPVSPGRACGPLALRLEGAPAGAILCVASLPPVDAGAMARAAGVVTLEASPLSHAGLLAREMATEQRLLAGLVRSEELVTGDRKALAEQLSRWLDHRTTGRDRQGAKGWRSEDWGLDPILTLDRKARAL